MKGGRDGPPVGSLAAGNMSPPQMPQAAAAVTMPAKPRKAFWMVVSWDCDMGEQGGLTRDCSALSSGVGMVANFVSTFRLFCRN